VKNEVSRLVSSHLLNYLDVNPLVFVTEMRHCFTGQVSSNFDKHLFRQVIDAYQNKFDALKCGLLFQVVEFQGFEFYKRNTKDHKTGDFKKVVTRKRSTPLSTCLTYLARYGSETTLEYIETQLLDPGIKPEKA